VFAENLCPGGRRTSLYSIQKFARRHPEWYRQDLANLLTLLVDGEIAPHIAATGPSHLLMSVCQASRFSR
jgi:hypothetical protein